LNRKKFRSGRVKRKLQRFSAFLTLLTRHLWTSHLITSLHKSVKWSRWLQVGSNFLEEGWILVKISFWNFYTYLILAILHGISLKSSFSQVCKLRNIKQSCQYANMRRTSHLKLIFAMLHGSSIHQKNQRFRLFSSSQ
jgi:hypothetical protein